MLAKESYGIDKRFKFILDGNTGYNSFIHGDTYQDHYGYLKLWIVPILYIVAFHIHVCMHTLIHLKPFHLNRHIYCGHNFCSSWWTGKLAQISFFSLYNFTSRRLILPCIVAVSAFGFLFLVVFLSSFKGHVFQLLFDVSVLPASLWPLWVYFCCIASQS